jgi:hypothetical protein
MEKGLFKFRSLIISSLTSLVAVAVKAEITGLLCRFSINAAIFK